MSPRLSGHPLEVVDQDPAGPVSERSNRLEDAIGRQVRVYRTQLGMTIANLARQADLSPGMLSKIENGQTSPSLTTLQSLAAAHPTRFAKSPGHQCCRASESHNHAPTRSPRLRQCLQFPQG